MRIFTRLAGIFVAACVVFLLGHTLWASLDRTDQEVKAFDAKLAATDNFGVDAGKGNLLGVQPWMVPQDYANPATLTAKFTAYLQAAHDKGWLSDKTVAVFPEYTGTWLIASGEKNSIYAEPNSEAAMTTVALTHLPEFGYRLASAPPVADKVKWALFSIKGKQAATAYQQVFGTLAKKFGISIVAGSIVLPQPELVDGQLVVHEGQPLYNVSAVFAPDGHVIAPLVVKVFPITDELEFIATGAAEALPVFNTGAGKLGVLICADAWYPANYAALKKSGAELLAVPSFSAHDQIWSTIWTGYNGAAQPADVDTTDIGKISEGDAWMKYAMPLRSQDAGIKAGLNVFLRGALWDLGSDGSTIRVSAAENGKGAIVKGATLTNLWLQ